MVNQRPATTLRIVGLALSIVAIILVSFDFERKDTKKIDAYWVLMFICALLAGVDISVSGGMLTVYAQYTSATFTSVICFATGLVPISLLLLYDMYFKVALLVSKYGASTFFGITIVAQIPTGLICDHFGLFGVPKARTRFLQYVGAALMVAAVVLVSVY
ncbi:hypothetical protein HDV06_005435 [Boothiomyces sp. JEL0866]|nr:hypothetical protein HDV06_005435 [Boothiomyces sp. JEL0866]